MRSMFVRRGLATATVALCGCSYTPPDTPVDAPPDTGACANAHAECVDDTLFSCAAPGAPLVEEACTWGCETSDGAHCRRITPAGGGATANDLDPENYSGIVSYSLAGVLDGGIGTINGNPAGSIGVGYQIENGVAVFRFADLSVGVVKLTGTVPIALVADGPIVVSGIIDATGQCVTGSPEIAGPGGANGGLTSGVDGGDPGGGSGGNANLGLGGGAGGGHGVDGSISGNAEPGGSAFGDDAITELRGGGGGGAGRGTGATSFVGGGGGGAIQLVSNTSIEFMATGSINAGGCGGQRGAQIGDEGGGGGAGGTILLEAPTVHLGPTSILAVNGGGGGGAAGGSTTAQAGATGGLTRTPANGGNGGTGGGSGGVGGAGVLPSGLPGSNPAGGGGGAVGRIRINTLAGSASIEGTMSPDFGDVSTATQGVATTQ